MSLFAFPLEVPWPKEQCFRSRCLPRCVFEGCIAQISSFHLSCSNSVLSRGEASLLPSIGFRIFRNMPLPHACNLIGHTEISTWDSFFHRNLSSLARLFPSPSSFPHVHAQSGIIKLFTRLHQAFIYKTCTGGAKLEILRFCGSDLI